MDFGAPWTILEFVNGSNVGTASISFSEDDLALFSQASHDRNPLHLSKEYARATAYGQPVVFGCLGAMACLGQLALPPNWLPAELEARFFRPMFTGVRYRVETSQAEGRMEARLFDGVTLLASLSVGGGISSNPPAPTEAYDVASPQRREAAARQADCIVSGFTVSGEYGCNGSALARLVERWGARPAPLPLVLCWASYLVGMELPGETALFSRLKLRFHKSPGLSGPMGFRASIASVDTRFAAAAMDVSLSQGDAMIASGQCWSYVRPPAPGVEAIETAAGQTESLAGRAAIILGSSRGLGAAMKQALESRGAAVFGMSRTGNSADPGRTETGDAADPEALRRLRERVTGTAGRLDFLICNAFPSVLPLTLSTNAAERIEAYIRNAVALTLAPLCEFLDLLNQCGGCAVIVSSAAVEQPVREWPHYIAAKRATEGLACVASLQYPRVATLIVRPPKLLTAMTNTPMGRIGATAPGVIAARIAARLENPFEPGQTEILSFPG